MCCKFLHRTSRHPIRGPQQRDPTPPYTNWAIAATTIQAAVDAAAYGDLVLVTNGVYDSGGRSRRQSSLFTQPPQNSAKRVLAFIYRFPRPAISAFGFRRSYLPFNGQPPDRGLCVEAIKISAGRSMLRSWPSR
jgi:hypothetical protein